jgi:hypothetical protein
MNYKFFLKRNKIIFTATVLILFLLVGGWYGQKAKRGSLVPNDIQKENAAEKPAPPKNIYSRITFFLRSPVVGSLAIPEYWEGKYRTKEEGNQINLNYADNPNLEANIFYIKYYVQQEWEDVARAGKTKEKELQRKDGFVYVYYIAAENPYKDRDQTNFKNMTAEASQIIQSLKLFKNN